MAFLGKNDFRYKQFVQQILLQMQPYLMLSPKCCWIRMFVQHIHLITECVRRQTKIALYTMICKHTHICYLPYTRSQFSLFRIQPFYSSCCWCIVCSFCINWNINSSKSTSKCIQTISAVSRDWNIKQKKKKKKKHEVFFFVHSKDYDYAYKLINNGNVHGRMYKIVGSAILRFCKYSKWKRLRLWIFHGNARPSFCIKKV